ncbi:hypothetical protein QTJ16_004929 [Diplocarpon rosae]|uniref:laccase n=1 Tax=Diplocarpon rosae TaxID=946125 RepID=A0AAD9SY08_9HELO|nr:hypothetical protein QTJ16_004929 [Diplocarpon rosae]
MKNTVVTLLAASASLASATPYVNSEVPTVNTRQATACEHTAASRNCWGDFSIDTNWYETTPETGVTREYWLSVMNTTLALDGFERQVLSFNGTVPGPAIIADWGDQMIIHVTNNMENNGTAIHWHGIRHINSLEYDGVPGVTQCPIVPGDTLTYKFQVTQYGSAWYHSHFTTQYGDGLYGPLIINGPATANYDEDLGSLFLSDWSHTPADQLWEGARQGNIPTMETGLINGTNTWNGGGSKFEAAFEAGKKYRIRLVNSAVDAHFQFSIDLHSFTVIGMDFVPLVPYAADSIVISMGQRYDIIVEANATSGNYWLRAGWITACSTNSNPDEITGIIRYDSTSTADPTTNSTIEIGSNCGDPLLIRQLKEPLANLVPYLALNVDTLNDSAVIAEEVGVLTGTYFTWTINTTSLVVDWSNPTTLQIFNNESIFPTEYNIEPLEITEESPVWAVYVIQDSTGFGVTHPIHLHGHDFWVIAQDSGVFNISSTPLNLINPPRRDVASLPGNGFLAIAFKKDNPGSWLVHCHIAWHASQGLAMQFVERQSEIAVEMADTAIFQNTCAAWKTWEETNIYEQEDSGI